MWLVVEESVYNALYNAYGTENPGWFRAADYSIDMSALIDAGIYEENEDGFTNQFMTPSQEGFFIPNT